MIAIILTFLLICYISANVMITIISMVFGYDELFPDGFDWDWVISIITLIMFGSIILIVDRWCEADDVISKKEFCDFLTEYEKKHKKSE